ncbi:MAG TPA: 2Fe-2S iron-sulfur cluster-binding protein [Baekduia sp.]|uniref:(2Fe-2S)-binding protein n=1 Tax=Baekduia sp. TaxID=2600305 RepID=UPI002B5573CA|nr:2Fe-2S iron-sulfur cluster-binding protein [Baekduia sp.]HMJ37685.1 2Fe-2S iron-sulfur cluster-binding protein [Baekduia sp.]
MRVGFVLDDAPVEVEVAADQMLAEALRDLGRLSVRQTCGIGVCGACTVLVDGEPASGCLMLTVQVEGRSVTTVDGLPSEDPVLAAFTEAHAFQCGWCTPGMVLTVKAMLADDAAIDRDEAAAALGGNLCRCGCYGRILDAVDLAAQQITSRSSKEQ